MSLIDATNAVGPPGVELCACASPVCPLDHREDRAPTSDPSLIGWAVGVRRVVVLPVPRLHRRFSLSLPFHLRRARV